MTDPFSLHKYMYAHANPVMGIDPSGRSVIGALFELYLQFQFAWVEVPYIWGRSHINNARAMNDVRVLQAAFDAKIWEWIFEGKRSLGFGSWGGQQNNFCSETGLKGYNQCGDQSREMAKYLVEYIGIKFKWTPDFRKNDPSIKSLYHQWFYLESTETDTVIFVDPWKWAFWPLRHGERKRGVDNS